LKKWELQIWKFKYLKNEANEFNNLKKALYDAKKDERAIIFTDTYEIEPGNNFNISPFLPTGDPYIVTVTWVYNHINTSWKNKLEDAELKQLLESNDSYGGFSNFPNFNTAFQNIYRLFDKIDDPQMLLLTTEQVKMLAHMHCYSVMSYREKFDNILSNILH